MLKGRGRDQRVASAQPPAHLTARSLALTRAPLAKPEPDYEVVEFPSDQYVNAKLQPPPPPPPRPPTGHPAEAASCGLCGGGGARVRCTECGRRALCASCDDMYHRHPKRRHHQRQALSLNQMRDERPPLPPKGTPPVPPPRRHKMSGDSMSASPRPPSADQRIPSHPVVHMQTMPLNNRMASQNTQQIPAHLQGKLGGTAGGHVGSMPYLPSGVHHGAPVAHAQANTLGHLAPGWQRPRGSLPGFNVSSTVPMAQETWEAPENMVTQSWGRPLRRGASVAELGGGMSVGVSCPGCAQCAGGWRYGSCASLDHQAWAPAPAWPQPPCCHPQMHPHAHPPHHMHAPYTPQPYRRADSRAASRAASRAGSRAASPAMSVRSRASRRTKHRTPSPPPLPSSDADSESESEPERPPPKEQPPILPPAKVRSPLPTEEWAGPPKAVPAAPVGPWQCEHCTFVNEAGLRVCAVCCRTPTTAPRELPPDARQYDVESSAQSQSVAASARSVAESVRGIERLDLSDPPSPPAPTRAHQNGESTRTVPKKERTSTACGPSPPREENVKKHNNRLVTPTREQSVESTRTRHDMAVGASPPREAQRASATRSPTRQNTYARPSPYRETKQPSPPTRHSISVGPSPPRENSIRPSPVTVQKKSAGTSPPRENESRSSTLVRSNVSNTGTSPPPQSISTQTYEVPNAWERAPSAARSRSRRRLRDDARRERSHSRHSLSSDTRESERSARTSGGGGGGGGGSSGRWEWRETRDSSPGGEWSGSERRRPRLARRASHLDLRRDRHPPQRRSSFYRSEAVSPEPTRAMSLEALASANGAGAAAASRGLELARLMADAERLGFSAAEVQAALAQSPAAPLAWLRQRWPSLCAGVRAAAARLAPRARVTDLEARAALARHRGAMWPAVTDCVERHRRQAEKESGTRQHGGRVWGSPAGADDDAAPPRRLREDSSDEFDGPPPTTLRDDDWMYLPLDVPSKSQRETYADEWEAPPADFGYREVASDVALELSRLLAQAGVPATSDDLILNDLLSNVPTLPPDEVRNVGSKPNTFDFIQSENDFIDAYNALTRSTPLPSVDNRPESTHTLPEKDPKRDMYDVNESYPQSNTDNTTVNTISDKEVNHTPEILMNSTIMQTNINLEKELQAASLSNAYPQENESLNLLSNKQEPVKKEISIPNYSNSEPTVQERNVQENKNDEETSTENFEESLPNVSSTTPKLTSDKNTKLENNSRIEYNTNQGLDKTSNLNDIVGNTQRLIQQMKDEINSDIHYIDSKNPSQSEPDSSSNDSDISSEHESSYSDTEEKETDNLSSNESEDSSIESEPGHLNGRRPTIVHRTSSEENDQFEEAMDHIEDQIEDFKNTNIEILDSIARSLQEEHSVSVELNEQSIRNDRREDLNNNLFVEVNSFEEIYAELNSNTKGNQKSSNKVKIDKPNNKSEINPQQMNLPKMNIVVDLNTVSIPNSIAPINQIISEDNQNKINVLHANLESGFVSSSDINVLDTTERDRKTSHNSENEQNDNTSTTSSDEESSIDSVYGEITTIDQNELIIRSEIDRTENFVNENVPMDKVIELNLPIEHVIKQNVLIENSPTEDRKITNGSGSLRAMEYILVTEQNVLKENTAAQGLEIENSSRLHITLEDSVGQAISNETNVEQNIEVEDSDKEYIVIDNRIEQNTMMHDIIETETVEDGIEQNVPMDENIEENITVENISEQNIAMNNNDEQNLTNGDVIPQNTETETDTEQVKAIQNSTEQIADSSNQNLSTENVIEQNVAINTMTVLENLPQDLAQTEKNTNEEKRKSLSKSPPKSPTEVSTNKSFITNKSNIPKLIKVVQNNKQKVEKNSPKVVPSKVPIRKASLKQYPAPTPPKTHFGNVQSGHVKQLQTRLFNNKFPKTVVNVPDVIDVKPSTSTMHKKKPAPPPPTLDHKPMVVSASPPKEKKNNFFRESCRTEDEWTESEAEDGPLPAPKETSEPNRAPSPPPPVTVRRVSGQIIDLARVRIPEGSPERQARMLLAEGASETWEQALLAVQLVSRGAQAPDALLAALECADLAAALVYLHQDCDLCASRLPEHEMVSMLRCTHRCCRECARLYFTVQITERSIADCVCPYCKEPDLEDTPEDAWLEYFAHLDILLKTLLETDVHELFQRKLRDRTLALDPNFRWCMECSSGFFVHPKQKKIRCPECRSVSCAKCRKTWSVNHEGLSCEQYAAWLDDNDPERSLAAVQQHLRENGLECPRCRFKYSLSRGGCMHFTCTQCKYEFCYGCGKPFMMGARCGLNDYCAKLGLHAHHPRNCLFYLRDKEPHELQTLLQMNNVPYETEAAEGGAGRCPVQLQRETPTGLVDGVCGSEAPANYAGLCKPHYVEYLAAQARTLDPIPIMDVSELVAELRRRALPLPERGPWDTDPIYAGMCAEIVKEKIPLD